MEKKIMKNIDKAKVVHFDELVSYQQGQVVSKTLVQNQHVSITLFAFDREEEIAQHVSEGDAMLTVLDGQAEITVGDERFKITAGDTIVMPADVPHAVYAPVRMKFLLTVAF